jgi:hypothetical protein
MGYKMHCLYIYKFSQLITWPEANNNQEFTIGFVGISPLIPELEQYTSVKNKSSAKKYKLVRFANVQAITTCNILYLAKDQLGNFDAIIKKTSGRQILVISEVAGLIKKGSCVNLISEEGSSIKIQINKAAIEAQKLKYSAEFLKLGNDVL